MPALALALLAFASARDPLVHTPVSTVPLTAGGLVWTLDAGSFRPYFALGDRGAQLVVATSDVRTRLFSAFDANPPTPVWTSLTDSWWSNIVASSESDVYLHSELRTRFTISIGILKKHRSRSNLPEWSFEFSPQMLSIPLSDLSRDGRTIVSVFPNGATYQVELRLHDADTGQAISTYVHPPNAWAERCDLSSDGTVVAFSDYDGTGTTEVYEVGTWVHLASLPGCLAGSQAISEGGGVVATFEKIQGVGYHVRAHERVPGGYHQALDVATATSSAPSAVVVSDDGSTLAAGWADAGPPRRAVLRAYDVSTAAMTMEHVHTGSTLPNVPDHLSIDAVGSRFAVGLNGTGSGGFPELAIYSTTSSTPLRTHGAVGAVDQVELSPDGKRYAAARRLGNGGSGPTYLELYEFGGEDLVVRGTPSVGATIDFEFHAAPGARASLLRSFALAPAPIAFPGVGTLHLDPGSLSRTPMGIVPPSGVATHSTIATTFPGMIGRTLWYQGFTTNPRALSNDFVQLTIVP